MSLHITEVAYICHPVTDMDRARKFYEGLLGLKPSIDTEVGPGKWWTEYDIAGTALAISNVVPSAGPGGTSIALEVPDINATLASIEAAGIALTMGKQDFPPCYMFAIKSPDGHDIMFHQRKS
jgi:predicted enzyme related to lactoylglutathione lyase